MQTSSWKRDIASGLIVVMPVVITAYLLSVVFEAIADLPVLKEAIADPVLRVLFALAVFVVLVVGVGYLMRTAVGDIFEAAIDDVMNQLPGLRVVYNASKMAVETAVSGSGDLQTPVKVTAWPGMRMTAFKTGKTTDDGRDILFLPTAPNITTGFVVEVAPEDYEESDERVEEALTRILSAGFGDEAERDLLDIEDVATGDGGDADDSEGSDVARDADDD